MGGLIKHPYDAKALVVCLLRMAGGDVHTPWTREAGGLSWGKALGVYIGARPCPSLRKSLILNGRDTSTGFARQVVETAGQERQAWLMGSDNKAAALIFAQSGLPVPDLGAYETDIWRYMLEAESGEW